MLSDLVTVAYRRYCLVKQMAAVADLLLQASVAEVAREDNANLATAARDMATAMATIAAQGWVDDETALTLLLKFAGEAYSREDVLKILATAKKEFTTESTEDTEEIQKGEDETPG